MDADDVVGLLVEALRRAVDIRDALTYLRAGACTGQLDSLTVECGQQIAGLGVRAVMLLDVLNVTLKKVLGPAIAASARVGSYSDANAWDVVAMLRAEGVLGADADVGEIRARCAAATPPPWHAMYDVSEGDGEVTEHHFVAAATSNDPMLLEMIADAPTGREDAAVIARAREDIPRLLDELDRGWRGARQR